MRNISILHNSRWGKSRATLQLLRDSNIEPIIINYLLSVPRKDELRSISKKLNMHPSLWIRKSEKDYKNNNLGKYLNDEDKLYDAMIKYPKIIERPIVIEGNNAIIGRPPENVLKIIKWMKPQKLTDSGNG